MSHYENHFNYKCESMISGNSTDIHLNDCNGSQIRADISVQEYDIVHLWGQIKSAKGFPIADALVKLVKVIPTCDGQEFQGIAHTVSDCNGFYQFELNRQDRCAKYKVIVNRSENCDQPHIPCTQQKPTCQCSECPPPCARNPQPCICDELVQNHCSSDLCTNITRHTTYDYSYRPRKK